MKLVDCTGKLNEHSEYLKAIKQLEKKSKYIEYVLVDKDETEFIEKFKDLIVSEKYKKQWWGTVTKSKTQVYTLKASKEIFKYLEQFETFCKYISSNHGDIVEHTDFGVNDIAFLDDEEKPLLFTTTHEGYITARDNFLKSL